MTAVSCKVPTSNAGRNLERDSGKSVQRLSALRADFQRPAEGFAWKRQAGSGKSGSFAESAPARLIGADRAQEVDFAEGRPEHVGEVELAVHALPQQKSGQADLAAGTNDQVGIRQAGGVEMLGDGFGGDAVGRLGKRRAFGR